MLEVIPEIRPARSGGLNRQAIGRMVAAEDAPSPLVNKLASSLGGIIISIS